MSSHRISRRPMLIPSASSESYSSESCPPPPPSSACCQTQHVPSKLTLAMYDEHGDHWQHRTVRLWPSSRLARHVHTASSFAFGPQILIILSLPQEARYFPEGDHATDQTVSTWPSSSATTSSREDGTPPAPAEGAANAAMVLGGLAGNVATEALVELRPLAALRYEDQRPGLARDRWRRSCTSSRGTRTSRENLLGTIDPLNLGSLTPT
mmetsp:Transcript_38827/g.89494  ORF Transcript_38827/g.89494 Transcript_38827/m.89494 type:complete len:210 (+) Transcript_38827:813-1442(+)